VRATRVLASIEIQRARSLTAQKKKVWCVFEGAKKMPERSRRRHRPARSPTRWREEPWPGRQATQLTPLCTASKFYLFLLGGIPPECFTSSTTVPIFCTRLIGENAFERLSIGN